MNRRIVEVFGKERIDGIWTTVCRHARGHFHGFGLDIEEDAEGFSSYSIAIVELDDGTVIMPRADMIKFTGEIA